MKEIKEKHSSRQVGGAETGSPGGEDSQKGGGWPTREVADCGGGGAGQAAASRPHKVVAGRPCGPTFAQR